MHALKGGTRPSDFAQATTDRPDGLAGFAPEKTRPEAAFHPSQLDRYVSQKHAIEEGVVKKRTDWRG